MLHFAKAEWDAMPWHDQQMYLEELLHYHEARSGKQDGGQIDGSQASLSGYGVQVRKAAQ